MALTAPVARGIREAEAAIRSGDTGLARDILKRLAALQSGHHPELTRIEALCAGRDGRFDDAVRLWRTYDRESGIGGSDSLLFGRALEQCGEIRAALDAYRALPPRPGLDHRGELAEASLHTRLGHASAAIAVLDAAVQACAGSGLEAKMRQARARQALAAGRLVDGLCDYVVLDQINPEDPSGLAGQIEIHLQNRDAASIGAALKLAGRRFSGDPQFLQLEARLINQQGSDEDIAAFMARLAALDLPDAAFRAVATDLIRGRQHYFNAAFRDLLAACLGHSGRADILQAVLQEKLPTTDALLARALKAVEQHRVWPDSPAGIRARAQLAAQLIQAERPEEASETIDRLESTVRDWPYAPPIIGEVLEWGMARRGALRDAQHSYWTRRRMLGGYDRANELISVRSVPGDPPPVAVFCVLRNELPMLPAFFRHYRKIGVERFVMVDNGSTDGSREWLAGQPDVELFRVDSSFRRARAGNAWVNPLIARPAYANTLCLRVDADEHLVYPHFETTPIAALWRHMQDEGAEVLSGFMLDLLPERMADLDSTGDDFTTVARYFDPPPAPSATLHCPYVGYFGGPRTRLLGGTPLHLTKSSGLRGGGTVEQLWASHETSPARVSSVGMVLLHYKFRPDFFERARRVVSEHQYAVSSQEFARYQTLGADRDRSLLTRWTREYSGSGSLLEYGGLKSTTAWDARCGRPTIAPAARPIIVNWPLGEIVRENWGDKLNPHLVQLLSGRCVINEAEAVETDRTSPIYLVIGSSLRRATSRHVVWGSGFIAATDRMLHPAREIRAVRGPLSRDMLLAQGIECPEVYGDPALLYPLFYRPAVAKTHDLGIVLHVRDRDAVTLPAVPEGLSVRHIDITGGIDAVVDEICACRSIASSSLHGIIAAHAYGVPATWLTFGDRLLGDGFKFHDYFASVGIRDAAPYVMTDDTDLRVPRERSRLAERMVDIPALIAACPFLDDTGVAELCRRARNDPILA